MKRECRKPDIKKSRQINKLKCMKRILYFLTVSFLVLCFGCKKVETIVSETNASETPQTITMKSYEDQVKYAESNLKLLGSEIGKLTKESGFVNFIHEAVSKKFDEEYEVLIKDLQKDTKWGDKIKTSAVNNTLKKFINIDGLNYYPQIYIPKFQANEDNSITTTSSTAMQEPIVYVFYGGDAEVDSASDSEVMPGYTTDSSGNLVYWGTVDSAYANSHEVWIYSINESVNNSGNLPCIITKANGINYMDPNCDPGGGGDGGGGGGGTSCNGVDCDEFETAGNTPVFPELGHAKTNFKIQNMTIKDPKESWLAGAAEVSIRAKLHCHNNRKEGAVYPAEETHYKSKQYSNLLGNIIRKFKRNEIRNQTQVTVNYSVESDWQYSNFYYDPIYCDFVIFERDTWPAKKNVRNGPSRNDLFQSPSVMTSTWQQNYRSAERRYDTWHLPYRTGTFCAVPNHTNFGLEGFSIDGGNVLIIGDWNSCTFNVVRY